MKYKSIWQEFECPTHHVDFDLADARIVHVGETIDCVHCGQKHIATVENPGQVDVQYLDGTSGTLPAPLTAADKEALLSCLTNPFGDKIKNARTGFGSDVSSQRLTPFEELMLEHAARLQNLCCERLIALDLFSGYCAANAVRLSQAGFCAYAVDFSPADASVLTLAGKEQPGGGVLHYLERDVRQFDLAVIPGAIDIVTCQRGLHFMRYDDARSLVVKLVDRLSAGGWIYMSVGAVDCAVGPGYKHADLPVAERWHALEPDHGAPIHVTEPLCLYKEEDIRALFADLGAQTLKIGRDDFGLFTVEFRKQ